MLRLVILVEGFNIGGAQRMVYEQIRYIDPSKVQLLVICYQSKKNTYLEDEVEKLCKVKYLDIDGHVRPKDFIKVFKEINAFNPDIVHTHLTGQVIAIPWSLIFQKPLVITAHTRPDMAFIKKTKGLLRYGLRHGRIHVVAVSEENYELMKQYIKGVDSRISCINNGVSIDNYGREMHKGFRFINVARQDANKNQALLINCFEGIHKEFPLTRLTLVGDGPCHKDLVDLSLEKKLEDYIEFTGSISNVQDYYAISDVYVQSSHREAMPMSVLEAMAAKLPIISTKVGGMGDVVKGNGFLIEDGDSEAFVQAMRTILLSDEQSRRAMGEESYSLVQEYSSPKTAEKYMELYEYIIK